MSPRPAGGTGGRRTRTAGDGRGGVEQQRDQVLDLLRRERAGRPEARHLRADVVRLGVVDFPVHVALHLGARATRLAESAQARADGAVRELLGRELVTVVAAAAGGIAGLVVPGEAAPALRDRLAALPIAEEAS